MKHSQELTLQRYRNRDSSSPIQAVECSAAGSAGLTFIQLHDDSLIAQICEKMHAAPLQSNLVSTTHVHGKPWLVFQCNASAEQVIQHIKTGNEQFEPYREPVTLNAWKVRSYLGFVGQSLQLASSFLRPRPMLDSSMFVFAASNLAANAINLIYHQGQEVEDTHQLRYLKQRINRELSPHLASGEQVVSVDSNRMALRPDTSSHKPMDTAKNFMRHHSVAIGELGLRYLGAIGLAFPARYWKTAWQTQSFPRRDPSELRVYAGLSSIFGKTVALTSRIPDPYNPKPATVTDTIREKFSFLAGGLIEITSFSALAYSCFFKTKENNYQGGLKLRGKLYPDFIGGIGASLFVLAYIVRCWAKYGERKVNMPELYAHASDMLAETPPEKVPQLLANTAASLAEHFENGKPVPFGAIYTNIVNDLSKFHVATKRPAANDPNFHHAQEQKTPLKLVKPAAEAPNNRVQQVQAIAPLQPEKLAANR